MDNYIEIINWIEDKYNVLDYTYLDDDETTNNLTNTFKN